ncbi:MAG: NADH-quinone oxidoreductase subunit A [Actinobacteria bacterium]|nr:NADH-quinone oxidoreductase subunit A [Actinomycetota bacterium]
MQEQYIANYFTVGLFFVVSVLFVPLVVFVTKFLAPYHPTAEKLMTYECGVPARGGIFAHYYVRYYIFALLFVIFDIEAVFLFPWAVNFRSLGIAGLVEVFIFIVILILGLAYAWKKGILKWVS